MTSPKDKFAPLRFSTDDLPERDRVGFVREVYGRVIVKHEIEPHRGSRFFWHSILHALPGLGLATMHVSGVRTHRTAQQIDSDDLVLNMTLSGSRVVRQFGREAVVGAGEMAVTRSADVAACEVQPDSRCLGIRIPVSALKHMIIDLDPILVRTIPTIVGCSSLLLNAVANLPDADPLAGVDVSSLAVLHVYDLVALTLGATREAAEIAKGRGLRVARLRAIKADIFENVGRRDLSLVGIARRHGISLSYLRKLFDGEGTNFTEFVLGQRIVRAHRMLCDSLFAAQPISAIAREAGFGDLSHFNQAFRRRYGATPSEVRETARKSRDG